MLTVLLATARAPRCFTHYPDWNQFEFLGRQLGEQTYRDFELVVVTPFVEEARLALQSVERLTVVEPRSTPWRRAKMFAVASARNTGLVHAKGDWVLTIDDCCEFGPDLLERVVGWAAKGVATSVMYRRPNGGEIHDARWRGFLKLSAGKDHVILSGNMQPTPQGYISFPVAAAVKVNGYDELRFDGARGLEDLNFSRRLMLSAGVAFAMDRNIIVGLHDHVGYPEEIIDNEDQNARCCNTAHAMAQMGEANRVRYTADEKKKILNCMYWKGGGKCGFHGHPCAYPKWAEHGHPVALRVLNNDEEELFDLAAARAAVT